MADSNKIYVGDIGTKIKLNAGESITIQTTLEIRYKKPDGTTGTWIASVEDSNYAIYVTLSGDLDQAGTWEFQIYVVLPASWTGLGDTYTHEIFEAFK